MLEIQEAGEVLFYLRKAPKYTLIHGWRTDISGVVTSRQFGGLALVNWWLNSVGSSLPIPFALLVEFNSSVAGRNVYFLELL